MAETSSKEGGYIHGHHSSVLRSHSWRTVKNSCPHLISHLKPGLRVLDIGCGPGTITSDMAANYVSGGEVIGIDIPSAKPVLERARQDAESKGILNAKFATGDIYALDFPDGTFDVVHTHQVLQHIGDPVRALREMRRVTKKGGIVSCREIQMSASTWYPDIEGMPEFHKQYIQVANGIGATPDAGRRLHVFAREAGWARTEIATTTSSWCFSTQEERDWWCNMWIDRLVQSDFKQNALALGGLSEEDLKQMQESWRLLRESEDGWLSLLHGEVICTVV